MRTFKSFTKEDVKEPVQPWDPSSEGEQRFKHLHNPVNYKDLVPGVTDQEHVFNGGTRKYDPPTASYEKGADFKAYDKTLTREEIEELDELSRKTLNSYAYKADKQLTTVNANGPSHKAGIPGHYRGNNKDLGKDPADKMRARKAGIKMAVNKLNKEEVESIDEGNPVNKEKKNAAVSAVGAQNKDSQYLTKMKSSVADKIRGREKMSGKDRQQYEETVLEKHLTPAEMKKREEIAKAMGRKSPKMDMAKKMAIATAQAKKVAESVTLDEKVNSQAFVKKYRENEEDNMHSDNVVHLAKHFGNSSDQKQALEIKKQHDKEGGLSRELGAKRNALHDKLWKKAEPHFDKVDKIKAYRADRDKHMEEEVEQIDEIGNTPKGKAVLKSYVKKALDTGSEKSISNLASRGGYESGKAPYDYDAGHKEDSKSVVRSQGVMNAVKRLTKESRELEEAKRGRPRKNPLPAGSSSAGEEEGGREHIIVQYRKAERMPEKEIEHNDNSKHSFPKAHYKKALDMHLTMKPSEKETFEKRLASSKASALSAVAGEPAPKPKPKISLGGKMQREAKDLDTKNPEGCASILWKSTDK